MNLRTTIARDLKTTRRCFDKQPAEQNPPKGRIKRDPPPFAKRKGDAERSERRGMPAPQIPSSTCYPNRNDRITKQLSKQQPFP